ncbi:MAG: hypothetical protein LBN10_05390 [Propionibacteriaceae bacterium]|nr:hypothetical protein [Propionibacteriaceae bacterium]
MTMGTLVIRITPTCNLQRCKHWYFPINLNSTFQSTPPVILREVAGSPTDKWMLPPALRSRSMAKCQNARFPLNPITNLDKDMQ